jgi:magnesium and cobalt exporter, CNNM family
LDADASGSPTTSPDDGDDSKPPGAPPLLVPVAMVVFAIPLAGIIIPLAARSHQEGAVVFLLVAGIVAAFFFGLVEEALNHVSPARLLAGLVGPPGKRARYEAWLAQMPRHRLVTHLSRDICRLGVFATAAALVAGPGFQLHLWELVAVGCAVYGAFVVLNGLIGGFFGSTRAEAILVPLLPFIDAMRFPLWPAVALVHLGWRGGTLMFGTSERSDEDFSAELIHFAEQAEDVGLIDTDEKSMLQKLIDFKDAVVEEVMTPRTEMVSIEVSTPIAEAMRTAFQSGYTRLPVFENDRDHVVGVFNTRDLMPMFVEMAETCEPNTPISRTGPVATSTTSSPPDGEGEGAHATTDPGEKVGAGSGILQAIPGVQLPTLHDTMREPYFVPESKDLGDLLEDMARMKISMAIVLDEYAGTAGLVTVEDIIEEIVGEIVDEFDAEPGGEDRLKLISEYLMEADARLPVDDLNELANLSLPEEEDFETVGGYLFYIFGAIPRAGDTIEADGCRFTILESEARRVTRVRIERLQVDGNGAGPANAASDASDRAG